MRIYAYLLAVLLIVGGVWYYGHTRYESGKSKGDKEVAAVKAQDKKDAKARSDAAAAQVVAAKAEEAKQQANTAAAERQMLQDFQNDKDKQAAVIAGLRAGTLRLRHEWTCPVPQATASAGKPDAEADLRAADAAALVRLAADADSEIRALQAVLTGERNP